MTLIQTVSETRSRLKDTLDSAESGVSVAINRAGRLSAVVDANRLRNTLRLLVPVDTQVFHEGDEWSGFLPSIPSVAGTGDSLDELFDDLVSAAREYATDWNDHLRNAPNHTNNWGFVQVVSLSSDSDLREWLRG